MTAPDPALGGRGRLVRVAAGLALCAAFGAAAASAQAEGVHGRSVGAAGLTIHGDASVDGGGAGVELARGSPSLPFRGAINYYGRAFFLKPAPLPDYGLSGFGLVYWNAADSSMAYVPMGDSAADTMCAPGTMVARKTGVEVLYFDALSHPLNGLVGFEIPWGDDAYPRFVFSPREELRPSEVRVSEDFVIDRFDVDVMRFTLSGEQRFYGAGSRGMFDLGSDYAVVDTGSKYATDRLAGSDGERYGFNITFGEPACGPQMAVVMSASTGGLVACGMANLGPVLVNFDESYGGVEEPVFPAERSGSADCDRYMDLRELGRGGVEGVGVLG